MKQYTLIAEFLRGRSLGYEFQVRRLLRHIRLPAALPPNNQTEHETCSNVAISKLDLIPLGAILFFFMAHWFLRETILKDLLPRCVSLKALWFAVQAQQSEATAMVFCCVTLTCYMTPRSCSTLSDPSVWCMHASPASTLMESSEK